MCLRAAIGDPNNPDALLQVTEQLSCFNVTTRADTIVFADFEEASSGLFNPTGGFSNAVAAQVGDLTFMGQYARSGVFEGWPEYVIIHVF